MHLQYLDGELRTEPVKCQLAAQTSVCPVKCDCSTPGVVNCRNAGLVSIPEQIPSTAKEL